MTQIPSGVQSPGLKSGTVMPQSSDLNLGIPRSRAEHLAAALNERIEAQGLQPGDLVGTLKSLREETSYARSTVSEAVRLLRERGVLEIRPGRSGGLFVAFPSPVVRLRHTLLTVEEQPDAVCDAIELRDHLEELIDVSASKHRTDSDITALRILIEEMAQAEDWDTFMRSNWALHERIAAITPNTMASAIYVGTLGHLSTTTAFRLDTDEALEYRTNRLRIHSELVEAIASGDATAVKEAVRQHNTKH